MSAPHHGKDPSSETPNEELRRQLSNSEAFIGELTGVNAKNYTDGRYDGSDDGELHYAVAASTQEDAIILRFPKPVTWIGFTNESAEELVRTLNELMEYIKNRGK
jgi:hypothetical protein